jgi:hypothetical protein
MPSRLMSCIPGYDGSPLTRGTSRYLPPRRQTAQPRSRKHQTRRPSARRLAACTFRSNASLVQITPSRTEAPGVASCRLAFADARQGLFPLPHQTKAEVLLSRYYTGRCSAMT